MRIYAFLLLVFGITIPAARAAAGPDRLFFQAHRPDSTKPGVQKKDTTHKPPASTNPDQRVRQVEPDTTNPANQAKPVDAANQANPGQEPAVNPPAAEPSPFASIHVKKATAVIPANYKRGVIRIEQIKLLLIRDGAPPADEDTLIIPFSINQFSLPFKPQFKNAFPDTVLKKDWKSNPAVTGDPKNIKMYDSVTVEILSPFIDTLKNQAQGGISVTGEADVVNNQEIIELHNGFGRSPNFFVGSFIKSIAGTSIPQNELLDILLKINLSNKEESDKRLWFSLIGADAGLSDTSILSLNEAVANVNVAINRIGSGTERIGFLGGGLKVFENEAYFGAHLGVMEIENLFQGSYFTAGYYYSPWIKGVKTLNDTAASRYRNNIFIEAAFNAFGDNAPKALQYIRLKFGLLLPFAVGNRLPNGDGYRTGDMISPTSKDFLYRLAVEVPIGGPIKF